MRVIAVVIILLVAGCAPRPIEVPPERPVGDLPERSLFKDAQQAYADGRYTDALEGFNRFLREVGHGRHADIALFRIGSIFQATNRDEDAISVFGRLTREYPYSQLAPQAHMAILQLLSNKGRYGAVVRMGRHFSATREAAAVEFSLSMVMAKAYFELDQPQQAAVFYYRAWRAAGGDEDADKAWTGLKKSVEPLGTAEIQELIESVSENRAMGFLLYRLGLAFIMAEQYDDALDVLSAFVAQFPDHKDYQDAADMVMSLTERLRFTPFSIGCLLPLSGSYAVFGQRALDGIELAIDHVGAAGGNDLPYRIIIKDTCSDDEAAKHALDELNEAKVGTIIGPMATAETIAHGAQAKGIPIMVFTQREGIAEIGSYVFRNFITPEMQVRTLVEYATGPLGIRRFAILYPKENYGSRYMNLFWDQVIAHDGVVTAIESYDPAGTDFAEPIKKLAGIFYQRPGYLSPSDVFPRRRNTIILPGQNPMEDRLLGDSLERTSGIPLPRETIDRFGHRNTDREDVWHPIVDFDAVFIPDAPKKAGLVIPQLAYYDIRDVFLLGTNLWNSEALLDMSGDYMQHTIVVDGFFVDSQSENVQNFVSEFESAFGRKPGIIEALAYDSTMIVLQTMRQTPTDSRRDLKTAFLQLHDYSGVSGQTRFCADGEAEKRLELLRIRHGKFVQAVDPIEPAVVEDVSEPAPVSESTSTSPLDAP